MNTDTMPVDRQQQDCDYIAALLKTISDNTEGIRLGTVNFSFVVNDSGELRMSGAQCWFSEKESDK